MSGRVTLGDLGSLPPVLDLVGAARLLGVGRTTAYGLARQGAFPCRVLKVGGRYRVPTADVLEPLGCPLPHSPDRLAPEPGGPERAPARGPDPGGAPGG